MVLPLLGTRRPASLPVEALEGSDDILELARLPGEIAAHCCLCDVKRTRCGGDDLMI